MMRAVAVLVLSWLLVACATEGSDRGAGDLLAQLEIEARDDADAEPRRATLRCYEVQAVGGGYLSNDEAARAACRTALEPQNANYLAEGPPEERICTQVYGGPQTARVRGEVRGRPVDVSFERTNGCWISDWERFSALLDEPPPPSPTPS